LRIDSALERQIATAEQASQTVPVWATVAIPVGKKTLSPKDVGELARRVVERVEKATGSRAEELEIYENLNAFSVNGTPELIRALARQPEIAAIRSTAKGSFSFAPVPTTPSEANAVRQSRSRGSRSR